MQPRITKVIPLDAYVLGLHFDNGEFRLLDMKSYLNFGVFQKLKDPNIFNTVHLSFDTIAWAGEIDLDPAFVYDKSLPAIYRARSEGGAIAKNNNDDTTKESRI